LVYDNETRTGNSGGPVLDKKGRVVGIHGLGLTDAGNKIGRNVAIPMKTFLNLFPQTKINLSLQIDDSPLTVPPPIAVSPAPTSDSPSSASNSSDLSQEEPVCAGRRCI
jgi:S1-C subfamily serine protease